MKIVLCFVPMVLAAAWVWRLWDDFDDGPSIFYPDLKIDLLLMVGCLIILFSLLFWEMAFHA